MVLPSFLQSSLASYDLSKMDKDRHKETIITEVLNKGNGQDLEWLCKTYTQKEIKEVVASPLRGMWFKEVLTYWQKILGVKIPRFKRELAYFNLNPNPSIYERKEVKKYQLSMIKKR